MAIKISAPFAISPRLLPGLKIGQTWVSAVCIHARRVDFIFDCPGNPEHRETISSAGSRVTLQSGFQSILSFLTAWIEARNHQTRTGRDSENVDLFPEFLFPDVDNAESELNSLHLELSETETLFFELE